MLLFFVIYLTADLPSLPRSPSLCSTLSLSLWYLGLGWDFFNRSEILQQRCRDACQFAGKFNDCNSQSRGIGTCGKTSVRLVNRGAELVPTKTKREDCSKCWCTECMHYFKIISSYFPEKLQWRTAIEWTMEFATWGIKATAIVHYLYIIIMHL